MMSSSLIYAVLHRPQFRHVSRHHHVQKVHAPHALQFNQATCFLGVAAKVADHFFAVRKIVDIRLTMAMEEGEN